MRKSLDVGILLLGPLPSFIDDDGHLFENAIEWLAQRGDHQGL